MAGPLATMILGDQGADVIKVESPEGDPIRTLGTSVDGLSAYFANLNRSKRSVVLDLSLDASRPVVDALLDKADVVIQNYRPGVATKLGLDADRVRAGRPGLVYAEIMGFGTTGPYAGRPAYDHVIQALSGFASIQADPRGGEPTLVRQGIIDKLTGMTAAQGVTAALVERARTGVGRAIEVRMLDVALSVLWPDGMMNHTIVDPPVLLPDVVGSFRLTRTQDGWLAFTLITRDQLTRLAALVGMDDDGRLATPEGRRRSGGEIMRQTALLLSQRTTDDAVDLLAAHAIPVAPVVALEALHEHPQIEANGVIDEFEHPVLGSVRQVNPAVRFGADRAGELPAAPRLGEHGDVVLTELGFDTGEITRLRTAGALGGVPAAVS
jgi:crotonobetainyl-CoA:carnitine CoA-transferase CaiB-like acyl-CoA transferase